MAHFSGETYDHVRDHDRLFRSLNAVRDAMSDGKWHTIGELAVRACCSEPAASARLRDLRKKRFGSYQIDREYVADGLWKYRMVR